MNIKLMQEPKRIYYSKGIEGLGVKFKGYHSANLTRSKRTGSSKGIVLLTL